METVYVNHVVTPGDKRFYDRWKQVGIVKTPRANLLCHDITILVTDHRSYFNWNLIKNMPNLKYVCVPNTSTEWIPKLPNGVKLLSLPLGLKELEDVDGVPQYTLKMILDIARPDNRIGFNLVDKKVCIWGYGRIGKKLGNYLMPIGAKIWPIDIGTSFTRINYYLENCDILSIHLPSNSSTYKKINWEVFKKLKKGCYFVNTSRAEIIEEDDLLRALHRGKLSGAYLDVYNMKCFENMANVRTSNHIAGYTVEDRIKTDDILVNLLLKDLNQVASSQPQMMQL